MSTTETEVNGGENGEYRVAPEHFTPPYVSWLTLTNLVDRIAKEGGLPSQIDRSYLSNLPGSTQTPLLAALKALRLVDDDLRPMQDLETWVNEPDDRQGLVQAMLEIYYPGPLGLPKFATQQQLENEFRKFGISGSTMRKAISFFLSAAKFAEIPLSPHFKVPRSAPSSDGAPAKPKKQRSPKDSSQQNVGGAQNTPPPPPLPAAMKHELIAGLIRELPAPGTAFPEDKQEAWFAIAKATFRLIYNTPNVADGSDVRLHPGTED